MNLCHVCGAPAAWLYTAPGITGGQGFCATCLPAHLRPLIGEHVTPVYPPTEVATSPVWEEAAASEAVHQPPKRRSRSGAKKS